MGNISEQKLEQIFDAGLNIQKTHYAKTDKGEQFNGDLTPANIAAAEIASLMIEGKQWGDKQITVNYLNVNHADTENDFTPKLTLNGAEKSANTAAKTSGEEPPYKVDLMRFEYNAGTEQEPRLSTLVVPANIFSAATLNDMDIMKMDRDDIKNHYETRPENDLDGKTQEQLSMIFSQAVMEIGQNNAMINSDKGAEVIGLLDPKMLPTVEGHHSGFNSIDKIMPPKAQEAFNDGVETSRNSQPESKVVAFNRLHKGTIETEVAKGEKVGAAI